MGFFWKGPLDEYNGIFSIFCDDILNFTAGLSTLVEPLSYQHGAHTLPPSL